MANDLSLLGGNLPAHLQGQLDETTKALMGGQGSGGSTKRISIRGSVFRMIDGGKEIAKNDDRAMNIVIVAAAPYNSRSFYTKTFSEGSAGLMPDCFSDDGITPNARSENKQAASCKDCPQNIAGSGQGTSRACRFSRRLAVLLENDQKGEVMQLTLPASSIFGKADNGKMPLEAYVKLLGANRVSVTSVVTEMRFDTSSSTPKLTFKAVRYLEADEFANAQEKGKSPEAKNAIGANPAELDKPALPQTKPAAAPAPAPKAEKVEAEPVAEPTKRTAKKEAEAPKDINSVLHDWT